MRNIKFIKIKYSNLLIIKYLGDYFQINFVIINQLKITVLSIGGQRYTRKEKIKPPLFQNLKILPIFP
jgi:hypothetical protein